MAKKVHFADRYGPICGAQSHQYDAEVARPLHERSKAVKAVTCLRCARKLNQWGFALQSFSEIVKETLGETK